MTKNFMITMAVLLVIAYLMLGCASTQKLDLYQYECGILGRHGVVAKIRGEWTSEVKAEEDAERVRQKLVKEGLISENTGVLCHRLED